MRDAPPGETYLVSRGITCELARSTSCKYAPSWGKIGGAVVFPIRDESGAVIAAAGRAIEGNGKQTFGPKSLGVFSTPGALEADPVAITEAPIDALTLALAGLSAIALCGTSGLPSWLIKLLATPSTATPAGHSRTVYLAFDGDPAGEAAATRIGAKLHLVHAVRLRPKYKDWNQDLTTDGLESLREWLRTAGVEVNTTWESFSSLPAAESQPEAIIGRSLCEACGAAVVLHSYPDGNGWAWYECDSCGEMATVQLNSK